MKPLKEYVYSASGRSINSRMNESHLRANGYSQVVDDLLEATIEFSDMTFTERLRMFVFNKIYINHCKTCDSVLRVWKKDDWKKFCCMSCAQNDPGVKSRMLAGQANVDWREKVAKRETTMQERYGYTTYSKTDQAKQEFATRTKEAWADSERKAERLEKRIETNLEKYGVQHTSQRAEQRIISGNAIAKTWRERPIEEKTAIIEKYRKSRLNDVAYATLISRELLEELCVIKRMSAVAISKQLNCAESAVAYAIDKHGLEYNPIQQRSSLECELYNYIKSIDCRAIQSYWDKKEIDIFIPELNLGFEFNGVYWHSEANRPSNYHAEKIQYFYDRDIRYIQIWEDDWINNQEVVKKFIKNIIGQTTQIGARKTKIVELSQIEFSTFMEENHLQGTTTAGIRLGLLYEDRLVSAMGFKDVAVNVATIGKTAELVRFANTNVTGAFTKLLKHFERTFDYDYIKSFADLEIVDKRSNVYSTNGFAVEDVIRSDYRYYNYRTGRREHKFGYRKSTFHKLGFDITNKTERELAVEYGLLRCYDSGKIKYTKKIDNQQH